MSAAPLAASLITCSYSGDLALCRQLCDSIDRFVPPEIGHTLYVPRRDLGLFAPLTSARRRLATQESLLPGWFVNLPMPPQPWRGRLRLPRRNVYLTPYSLPVRGWIAQQIIKIAAACAAEGEIVVHIDSDNALIRPLTLDRLAHGELLRLYRSPVMIGEASHRRWHRAAGTLLGLTDSDFHGAEYIDQIVVWRRSVANGLVRKLAEVSRTDWRIALARTPHFAEYILYGVYADRVLGLDAAGHRPEEASLCLSRWTGDFRDRSDRDAFLDGIAPHHVACLVQSTIAMSEAERLDLCAEAARRAAGQDGHAQGLPR